MIRHFLCNLKKYSEGHSVALFTSLVTVDAATVLSASQNCLEEFTYQTSRGCVHVV